LLTFSILSRTLGTMSISWEDFSRTVIQPSYGMAPFATMRRTPGEDRMARETVTIIDVARKAGVSKSAAARVLARNGSASAATREKVLHAASELGYRPNQLARAMKSGATNTIGIVVPDVIIPFFSAV